MPRVRHPVTRRPPPYINDTHNRIAEFGMRPNASWECGEARLHDDESAAPTRTIRSPPAPRRSADGTNVSYARRDFRQELRMPSKRGSGKRAFDIKVDYAVKQIRDFMSKTK
jgi:hypothetical protein